MMHLKKIIAIFLCITMVLGSTLTAFAAEDLEMIENQERIEEVLESSESVSLDVEEVAEGSEAQIEKESTEVEEESLEESGDINVSPEVEDETKEVTTVMDEEPEEDIEESEVIEETNVEDETSNVEDETRAEEETTTETLEETTEVAETVAEEKLLTAEPGAVRVLNPGWNIMKGNSYWTSPLTDINVIEFRESNEDFTHDDMYYTWEDSGIKFYVYEMWDTDDHSYTSSGFGVVIQVAEGEKLQTAVDASSLFADIDTLKEIKNLEMLDTSNTEKFDYMFDGCDEIEVLDLTSFDTSKAKSMTGMFRGCSSLSSLDISSFNTSNVWNMAKMFENASSLETIDVSNFDTSNVVKMQNMFATGEKTYNDNYEYLEVPSKLTEIIFGDNFNTREVNDMSGMFQGTAITSLDLTHFDTSSVYNMSEMFDNCALLEEVDLSSFDTSCVKNFNSMFADCYRLSSIDLSNFDTSSAESYSYMFLNCYEIEEIDASNFQGKKVWEISNMFSMSGEPTTFVYDGSGQYSIGDKPKREPKLRVVDISGLELEHNEIYSFDMFTGASNLTTIYASTKFVNGGRLLDYMLFKGCESLVGGNGTVYDSEHIWTDYAVVDTDETPGYFTDKSKTKLNITFITEYGEAPEMQTISYGETVVEPEELIDEDNIFEYWYLDDENERFDFSKGIKASITLTAKWKSKPTWTVTFKNEIANSNVTKVVKDGKTVEEIEAEEVDGYRFEHWYLNDESTVFDFNTVINEDITLYAYYIQTNFKITYNLKGGSFVDGFTAKDRIRPDETYELPTADKLTKEEANFLGWYDNEDFSGDVITTLENIRSDIAVYVKWEDFCIITMNPGPSDMDEDENYIIYGGKSYNIRVKVGDTITVPVNDTKAFLYYDYFGYCRILGGDPSDKQKRVYYEAYDENGWYLGKFFGGEEITISAKKIKFKSYWWIYGGSQITYEEILKQYGEPTKDCPLARQRYNEKKAASAAKPAYKNNNAGHGGGGGGGGGSGLKLSGVNPLTAESPLETAGLTQMNQLNANQTQEAPNAVKTQAEAKTASSASYSLSKDSAKWSQNADGTWSMSVNNGTAQVAASNGFYSLSDVNAATGEQTKAVYYFDEKGQMATGWVKDAAGSMYFFETANTADVGKMTTGWKQINGGYYYFGSDGKMYTNGVTPDGYKVGADGVWTA